MSSAATGGASSTERLASIQAMRGVAALAVVVLHAAEAIDRQGFILTPLGSKTSIGNAATVGAAGVDLFFVISGFVMAWSTHRLRGRRDAAHFLLLRLIRVAPLFWILSVPMAAWWLWRGVGDLTPNLLNTFTFVPLHLGPYAFPAHGVGWTLSFEFLFYGLVAALICTAGRQRMPALAMLLFALPLLPLHDHAWALARWLTNPILAEFGMGVVAFMLWRSDALERYRRPIALAAVCAIGVLVLQNVAGARAVMTPNGVVSGNLGLQRALVGGLPCLALFLWALPKRPLAPLLRLGDASYSLYLIHPLVMIAAGLVLPRSTPGDVAFAGLVAASIVAALAVYRWVERPMTDRLRALASAARTAPATA